MNTVMCVKFKEELEALSKPPLLGKIGIEVQSKLSVKGWELWKQCQTMLINETRYSMMDPYGINYILGKLEEFLEGDEIETMMLAKLVKQGVEIPADLMELARESGLLTEDGSDAETEANDEVKANAEKVEKDDLMFYEVK